MNVQVVFVGEYRDYELIWPADLPLPEVGEPVTLPSGGIVYTRTRHWYPAGDPQGGLPQSSIVLVLGNRRA